ncbi:MAG: amidohydrolase [Firmicutes bacterium]|nr:amidohydrolase [Bacillota bacterium]
MEISDKQIIQQEIDQVKEALWELSHKIHKNPELGFQEEQAVKWQTELLKQHGFHIQVPFAGLDTSYKATFAGKGKGPKIAFLAEYDALKGLGHACGHNLIAAMSVGAAIGLSKLIHKLDGEIIVLGCPGEEGGKGKVIMLNNGGFDDIDFAMMIHPATRNLIGRGGLASSVLDVEFFGKAAHSKEPAEGINALTAIINTFTGIDTVRQLWRDDSRINGIIVSGGTAPNIIPEYASARFTVRAKTSKYLLKMIEDIKKVTEAAGLITGARPNVKVGLVSTERYSNSVMGKTIQANMKELGIAMEYPPQGLAVGSSDFGNVSMTVPAIHEYLAIAPLSVKNHTKQMAEAAISKDADEVLIKGAKGLAMTGYDILYNEDLRDQIRFEFQKTITTLSSGQD